MDDMLKALYDSFYTPPGMAELNRQVEDNHRLLIERLEKPERKLVLRIIDAKNAEIAEKSLDSFICGFRLAWQLTNELNNYENRRSTPAGSVGLDACFASEEGESQ
jgi:hypothetical protein